MIYKELDNSLNALIEAFKTIELDSRDAPKAEQKAFRRALANVQEAKRLTLGAIYSVYSISKSSDKE